MCENKRIIKTILETTKDYKHLSNEELAGKIDCSTQSIRNWLKEKTSMDARTRRKTQKYFLSSFNKDEKNEFMRLLNNNLEKIHIGLPADLYENTNFEYYINYLLFDYQKESEETKEIYLLLNTLKNNPYIEEIIRKKMEVNAKKYGFFRVIQTSSSDTLLEFWDLKQRYCYKVLISYYCMTPFSQNRNAALKHNIEKLKKPYQADMILQFSFFEEQPETIFSCIKENLYIDKILPNELVKHTLGKDFVYINDEQHAKEILFANQFADILLAHLSKYFSVIYKNVFFSQSNLITLNNPNPFMLWQPKITEQEELNFEGELLENKISGNQKDLLIVFGFSSFPLIFKLMHNFKRIVFLDTANKCISTYTDFIHSKFNNDETNSFKFSLNKCECEFEFVEFTAAIADYVSKEYTLYSNADMIICGMGNASLIRALTLYSTYFNRWLKQDGLLWISFFNGDFLYDYQSKYELAQSTTYLPLKEDNRALVADSRQDNKMPNYYVYCKHSDYHQLEETIKKFFLLEQIYSYPLSPYMSRFNPAIIQNILKQYDKEHSKTGVISNRCFSRGYYIGAFAKKQKGNLTSYPKLNIQQTVKSNLDIHEANVLELKTILLKGKGTTDNCTTIYSVILPKNKLLPETKEAIIRFHSMDFDLLSVSEINRLGFEVGNVPPFFKIADSKISVQHYIYFGDEINSFDTYLIESGNPYNKYLIDKENFSKYLNEYHYIEAI